MEPPARHRSLSFFSGFSFHALLLRSKSSPSKTKRAAAGLGTVIRTVPAPTDIPVPTDAPVPREIPVSKSHRRQSSNAPSRVQLVTGKTPRRSFTVFRTRRYTKEPNNRDSYIYQEFEIESPSDRGSVYRSKNRKLPSIKISPPDGLPYRLPAEEVVERWNTSAGRKSTASDTGSLDKSLSHPPMPLSIDTKSAVEYRDVRPPSRAPPSPPLSPPSDDGSSSSPTAHDFFQPPCRAPPSPPSSPVSLDGSFKTSLSPKATTILSVPDDVLFQIFTSLSSFSDLRSLVLTHPRFHAVYAGDALYVHRQLNLYLDPVMHSLLEALSPSTGYTAEHYISTFTKVFRTLNTVRDLVRRSPCKNFLSAPLLDPGNAVANVRMYRALVNISAFCVLFGGPENVGRKEAQRRWLRRHLGEKEILEVLEMWQCLAVLLRPLVDGPELAASFEVISEGSVVRMREELELFSSYLLTLGPHNLLPIFTDSLSVEERWGYIVENGLHTWDRRAGAGCREWFLKGVAGEVYGELFWDRKKERESGCGIEEIRSF